MFDLLRYPARCGGINHIATVLSELTTAIDYKKLLKLADHIGETAWLQRFGFILETIDTLDEDKTRCITDAVHIYLHAKPLGFVSLSSELPKTGYPRVAKWKIIANTEIESDL